MYNVLMLSGLVTTIHFEYFKSQIFKISNLNANSLSKSIDVHVAIIISNMYIFY